MPTFTGRCRFRGQQKNSSGFNDVLVSLERDAMPKVPNCELERLRSKEQQLEKILQDRQREFQLVLKEMKKRLKDE